MRGGVEQLSRRLLFSRLSTTIATGPEAAGQLLPPTALNHPDGRTDNSPLDNMVYSMEVLLCAIAVVLPCMVCIQSGLFVLQPAQRSTNQTTRLSM
mmetsp:Transcript_4145/g.10251  ORF Transcript_4145/g.10251 Transcript_4145/m.10251 type:complete len:96 (-) Transcript_4145:135-422(-)